MKTTKHASSPAPADRPKLTRYTVTATPAAGVSSRYCEKGGAVIVPAGAVVIVIEGADKPHTAYKQSPDSGAYTVGSSFHINGETGRARRYVPVGVRPDGSTIIAQCHVMLTAPEAPATAPVAKLPKLPPEQAAALASLPPAALAALATLLTGKR